MATKMTCMDVTCADDQPAMHNIVAIKWGKTNIHQWQRIVCFLIQKQSTLLSSSSRSVSFMISILCNGQNVVSFALFDSKYLLINTMGRLHSCAFRALSTASPAHRSFILLWIRWIN